MTHSLEALKSGRLTGTKRLKLACGLKEFPEEILLLADTLEILDLSDNKMTTLPDSISQLENLKVVFFARNSFTTFPTVLAACSSLSMIGFKSNQIETIPEKAFPPKLRWLILADNKIKSIPKSIGDCKLLQKCGLAGNLISELPTEMSSCKNLELLRISANRLEAIPQWLFELPRLSWVAFGGNPASHHISSSTGFRSFHWSDFTIGELLGEGASGMISKAKSNSLGEDLAIKVFKGEVTTDGLPEDEMRASIASGKHASLIPVLGEITDHPEGKNVLVMELISSAYSNLGNPPSFETCTRDVFNDANNINEKGLLNIAKSIASVACHLHSRGVNHGDLYAHNILIDDKASCLLGDFGAASFYDVDSTFAHNIERIEVSAFGCLIEDVLDLVGAIDDDLRYTWQRLIDDCMMPDVKLRPSFSEVLDRLNKI